MENTRENKSKFFAIYYGIDVFRHQAWTDRRKSIRVSSDTIDFPMHGYLTLYNISSITDEDATEVAKIACRFLFHTHKSGHEIDRTNEHWVSIKHPKNTYSVDIDFSGYVEVYHEDRGYDSNPHMVQAIRKLQELGYYVGDGTEVEYGWVKLKDKEE